MTIEELRSYQDKACTLHLHDGEIARVRIVFVDAEYEDIIVDLVQTSRSEQYQGPPDAAYAVRAADIASVEESPDLDLRVQPGVPLTRS